jgi:hypothetical protein
MKTLEELVSETGEVCKLSPAVKEEDMILGLHEAATKIWEARGAKRDEELPKKIAAALIAVFEMADHWGVRDIEGRIAELHEVMRAHRK